MEAQFAPQNDPNEYRGDGQDLDPNHPTNDSGEFQEAIVEDEIENRDIEKEIDLELQRSPGLWDGISEMIEFKLFADGSILFYGDGHEARLPLDEARERLTDLPDSSTPDEFWHVMHQTY